MMQGERTSLEKVDHAPFREWLLLDGGVGETLSPVERRQLEAHLDVCADCRRERTQLVRMDAMLTAERLPVAPDLKVRVMASLPAAGWEGRSVGAWHWPVAVLLALGAGAAALLGMSSTALAPGGSFLSALSAVVDLLAAGALTGAGMASASWRGLGLILDRVLSPTSLLAFAVLVISLDLLVVLRVFRRGGGRRTAGQLVGLASRR